MSTEITITSTTIDINVSEYPITIEAPSGAYPLPTSVYSVFGRTGNVVATEGDYTLTQLAGVTITSPSAGQALVYNGTAWVNNTETYVGTVTSVAATVPTGLTITGSPITTSGTLAFGLQTGYSIPTTANQATWDAAYNDKINSAAVTGTTTKTLTLNQQDGGTVTASWTDDNTDAVTSVFGRTGAVVATEGDYTLTQLGDVTITTPSNGQVLKYNGTQWVNGTDTDTGLTSVGLSMPSAFSVANSPLTANGTLAVTGAGVASQYIRGDGTLANFPTSGGGGSSVAYYFNSSVSQGTLGGVAYRELSKVPIIGAGTDITIATNGYIANYITDAGDPSLLEIPAGNWNFEVYFSASSGGGSPSFYVQLYKYDGTTFTLISSSSATPEGITNGTAIDLYTTALAVPLTTLTLTDRLAIRVYVNNSGRTITLHTENSHLCEVITTFSTGITALNGLTAQVQYFQVGTSGTDFNISSTTATHTFNIPTASATNRGLLSSADWSTFNAKQSALTNPVTGTGTTNTLPKFTGASAIGDSNITDTGSLITLGSDTYISSGGLGIGTSSLTGYNLRITSPLTGGTSAFGVNVTGQIQSDVTSTARIFGTQPSTIASAFTLASLQHFTAGTTTIGAGSAVTNQFGFLVLSTVIGATNNYAFSGQLAAATNTWNLYMSGTANNYMAGSLGIGSTSLSNINLRLGKNITGSTDGYNILADSSIASDVTANAYVFRSLPATVAVAFTLSNLYHFSARQNTIGAGSVITNQYGFAVESNLTSATNNYGFYGNISSGTNRWNLYMNGTAENYLAGNLGLGANASASAGPITSITLTNGGSGYVDGTYNNVFFTSIGQSLYAQAAFVVSGGIVTSATLVNGGSNYVVGQTLTTANTNLGGTGSGLVVTVAAVDSSVFRIQSTLSPDISLFKYLISSTAGSSLGSIKWEGNDSSGGASGIQAKIGAFSVGGFAGGYLSFFTKSSSTYTSLVEAMRIGSEGNIGISATILTGYSLKVSKPITGAINSFGIASDGTIQSDVTNGFSNFRSAPSTVAASFTLANLYHYAAVNGTLGAGSTITDQFGYWVSSSFTNGTNNYAFYSSLAASTNRWNLYMNGTAANYMAGQVAIGTTTLVATAALNVSSTTQGFLPPVMTTTQKNAISSPATGLVVFDSTLGKLCVFSTTWQTITSV